MLMRGLWALTWLEIKIFLREPLGAIGTIVFPVLAFVVLQRTAPRGIGASALPASGIFSEGGVPVFVSILIAISAVLSLVTIIAIYREGGILKRLRATPLRPPTILTAAAHWRNYSVSDDCPVGNLRARRVAASGFAGCGARAAADVCGVAPSGDLAR